MPSPACTPHPCVLAFEQAVARRKTNIDGQLTTKNSGKKSKLEKVVNSISWRGRSSTAQEFEVLVRDELLKIKQVMGGEHYTSKQMDDDCSDDVLVGLGTGATCWPASLVLTKYLEKNWSNICKDCKCYRPRVVELGCGTGIVSIATKVLGAREVLCTDGAIDVVQLAKENVLSQNYQSPNDCNIYCSFYRWSERGTDEFNDFVSRKHVDLVVASDCVLPKLFPIEPLVQALKSLLRHQHSKAYLSYEHRHFDSYNPREKFTSLAKQYGLQVVIISDKDHDDIYSVEDIEIWKVQKYPDGFATNEALHDG
mmetsp:Transcript_20232/g.26168  ORF Transcript_20232/g.26168 Transcript_20232/m.26168 type:complete len:310 (+) Transcript_20232:162-1091(+)